MPDNKVLPRETPDRDARYMGLAWFCASFSKDPSTQVGACIVGLGNLPLGMGYNGPPREVDDSKVNWNRPPKDDPDAFSKYDIIIHAEANAIDHSACNGSLDGATLYVTALPCPSCMREIVRKKISRVVYTDFQSGKSSSLQNASWRGKSFEVAKLGGVQVNKFEGNLNWMPDWIAKMRELGIFDL